MFTILLYRALSFRVMLEVRTRETTKTTCNATVAKKNNSRTPAQLQQKGFTRSVKKGRPALLPTDVLHALADYVDVRAASGWPLRPVELDIVLALLTDTAKVSERAHRTALRYLRFNGFAVRSAKVKKKNRDGPGVDRLASSFDDYKTMFDRHVADDPTFGPERVLVVDETSLAMETANAGGGEPSVIVRRSSGRRITLPGIEKGALPSCTYVSVVSLAGVTICHAYVFKRRMWVAKDFTRKFTHCEGDHVCIDFDGEDVLIIGNETGKFCTDDYHLFVDFALRRARRKLANSTADAFLYVHDNTPAHESNAQLDTAFGTFQTSCVTLGGGVTGLVQIHDVALFGGFKHRVKVAMLNLRSVLCFTEAQLGANYELENISREHRKQQKFWLANPKRYEDELVADAHKRLRGHDPVISVQEMVVLGVTVWRHMMVERPTRVVDAAAFLGYYPLSMEKWMATMTNKNEPIHKLLAAEKLKLRQMEESAFTKTQTGVQDGDEGEEEETIGVTRAEYQLALPGVPARGADALSESDRQLILLHGVMDTLCTNHMPVSEKLSAVSVLLRDGVHEGAIPTSHQKLLMTPSGRTLSVGARNQQNILERVSGGGTRERGSRFDARMIHFSDAARKAVEMDKERSETAAQKKQKRRPGVGRPVDGVNQPKRRNPAEKITRQAKGKGPAKKATVPDSDSSGDSSSDSDDDYEEDWASDDGTGAGPSKRGAPSSPDLGANRPKRRRVAPKKLFTPNAT